MLKELGNFCYKLAGYPSSDHLPFVDLLDHSRGCQWGGMYTVLSFRIFGPCAVKISPKELVQP